MRNKEAEPVVVVVVHHHQMASYGGDANQYPILPPGNGR